MKPEDFPNESWAGLCPLSERGPQAGFATAVRTVCPDNRVKVSLRGLFETLTSILRSAIKAIAQVSAAAMVNRTTKRCNRKEKSSKYEDRRQRNTQS